MLKIIRMIYLGEGSMTDNCLLRGVHMLLGFAFMCMGAFGLLACLAGIQAEKWNWVGIGVIFAVIGGYAIFYRVAIIGWKIGTGDDIGFD